MERQGLQHQRGEIEFRRKLYAQQVENSKVFEDEFDGATIERILLERMGKTLVQMSGVKARGIATSPYVEIGAERCQRSLVMENELGLTGAAVDISYEMLRSAAHYGRVFNKSRMPLRICCDVNNLPFASGSIPFVFCYETLHHFPDPAPVTREIERTLAPGGSFFFEEEPYKRLLHVGLYRTGHMYAQEQLARSMPRRILDRFFAIRSCNETEHGVIENEDIALDDWRRALECFGERDVRVRTIPGIEGGLFEPGLKPGRALATLLGGNVSGTCRKLGDVATTRLAISETLICPSCRQAGTEARLDLQPGGASCCTCGKRYPSVDEILFLFAYDTFEQLYPDVFRSL
ncbi:MAG TPA: class I SAM-dependent methyltransferase [Polyangia bacterium]|jgi:SAM-dependent methyltransferase